MRQLVGLVKHVHVDSRDLPPPRAKAMRVTVDGETIWSRQCVETTVSPLRYEWEADGLVIINERVEAERREAIARLQDPLDRWPGGLRFGAPYGTYGISGTT